MSAATHSEPESSLTDQRIAALHERRAIQARHLARALSNITMLKIYGRGPDRFDRDARLLAQAEREIARIDRDLARLGKAVRS